MPIQYEPTRDQRHYSDFGVACPVQAPLVRPGEQGLFIRRPFFERIHYDIVQAYLVFFFREARRVIRLKIVTEGPTPDAHPGEPLLVCCRHAGPGDSFTLMYALMHWYHREPRVVLKDTLAWDPAIGVILLGEFYHEADDATQYGMEAVRALTGFERRAGLLLAGVVLATSLPGAVPAARRPLAPAYEALGAARDAGTIAER